jgi:hypothetical protein
MSILIFIIVVIVLLALALWAIRMAPIPSPLNWILQLVAVVIAIIVIGQRAGLF